MLCYKFDHKNLKDFVTPVLFQQVRISEEYLISFPDKNGSERIKDPGHTLIHRRQIPVNPL